MQPYQRQGQADAKSDDSFSYADAKDGIQTRDLQQQQRISAAADFKRSFSESESESGYKSTSTVSLSIPRRSAVVLNKNSNNYNNNSNNNNNNNNFPVKRGVSPGRGDRTTQQQGIVDLVDWR